MKVSNLAIKERNIPINRLYFRRNLRRRNYHSLEKGFYIAEFDCGDNPVKYLDPNGLYVINNVASGAKSALDYVKNPKNTVFPTANYFNPFFTTSDRPGIVGARENQFQPRNNTGIQLPGNLNRALDAAIGAKTDNNSNTQGKITAGLTDMGDGVYGISVTTETSTVDSNGRVRTTRESGIVAYARLDEIKVHGTTNEIDYDRVGQIANETINIVRDTPKSTANIDEVNQ